MVRFGFNFGFTPDVSGPGNYMFAVTIFTWDGDDIINTEIVLRRTVHNVEETSEMSKTPAFAVAMVDLAYAELAFKLAELTEKYNSEVNARPSSASTN
jgi:hypothetical protein